MMDPSKGQLYRAPLKKQPYLNLYPFIPTPISISTAEERFNGSRKRTSGGPF